MLLRKQHMVGLSDRACAATVLCCLLAVCGSMLCVTADLPRQAEGRSGRVLP